MRSDAILMRLLELHPKIIDLSLTRMERLLERLDHPERKLPPVIHIAGTNGKGSTLAMARAMLEAAGCKVHTYTSPHLVRFHERIRLAGELISEPALVALLEECEAANGKEPITFFEITTAAAFLAYSRTAADYLLLEVGLGGRLDATNVIDKPAVTVITSIGLDHQQYLGDTIEEIAREKAGILKRGVLGVLGVNEPNVRDEIERVAEKIGAPITVANQDWQSFTQHGRLVFQDENGLLDLPLPALAGPHQIDNAGNAIAALRALKDDRITEEAIAVGLKSVTWPARMQKLGSGYLSANGAEIWLDGGHNGPAGPMVAQAMRDMPKKPLVLIWGMLNTKISGAFISHFKGLAEEVIAITIPDEINAISAEELAEVARKEGLKASTATSIQNAVEQACLSHPAPRLLICGSLYLAGHVLALHSGEEASAISGAAKR
ncbi:bifunctional folylpolyglutamate synthase/dihydrofolate synthase [Aestuariivirga litoralis]|uniref:bifunctional folylpolyglutamate synthase/dihydrofolate synthase n=1 Tax=Aestuariivirga litoralis TaxID=2650924 RepID=UPI0018C5EA94|nr:folylpolyglutamate synthase/dihydrofolate synthase family protein [Aestuariivirga litoralis]MBG1233934.1 bifunctional folylpolyglutamate synthase/dihydrofolate synthase [Aestuariivirga litoralis]